MSNAEESTLVQLEAIFTQETKPVTNILMPNDKSGSRLPSVKQNIQISNVVLTQYCLFFMIEPAME